MSAKKKTNSKKIKVLHITDFEKIFEPSDAKRKKQQGPLSFTKSLVTTHFLSKEAEIRYFERIKVIKAHTERHLLRSTYEDLKNWTAGKYLGPRGFLVNADYKPASYAYLSDQLDHIPIEDLKKSLPILERIGLLERIDFDGFPDAAGRGRTQPDGSGRERKPLNKSKSKNKSKAKKKVKSNDSGKSKGEIKNGNGNRNALNSPEAPAAAPPLVPQLSAEKGGARLIKLPAPSAVFNNRDGPEKLGSILGGIKHRFDLDAKRFGGDIYRALKLPWDPSTPQGRRELGCFASLWTKAKASGLPPPVLTELWDRVVDEARKIAKRRGKCSNVSAVFCHVFNRIVAARGMAAGPPRQGVRDG